MNSSKSIAILVLVAAAVAAAFYLRAGKAEQAVSAETQEVPVTLTSPTFIELGSDRCTSCRAMIPVLEELRNDHKCTLNVRFIDVWDSPEEGERFDITVIPSQVLLAPDGRELTRHTGFWSADAIKTAFASSGHPLRSCE